MREIGVQGLCFGAGARPGGGIANVTQAHVAPKVDHVMGLEHVLDETVVFAEVEAAAFGGYDACGVLAAVLEHG
jgi:hypothetical protein